MRGRAEGGLKRLDNREYAMAEKVAVIGRGLVGRAWSVGFARAGWDVALTGRPGTDPAPAFAAIDRNLADLEKLGEIPSAKQARARITAAADLATALQGATIAIENYPEDRAIKRAVFTEMDRLAARDVILCSSASGITTTEIASGLPGEARIVVTHPCNPPSFLRVVELAPAPFTAPAVVARCREIMESIGKSVTLVKKEIEGFILNRLHIALVVEALRLVDQGYVSAEDLEKVVKDGVGPRWALMGPFETLDLNGSGFKTLLGGGYGTLIKQLYSDRPWRPEVIDQIQEARRKALPIDKLDNRRAWRDRYLMQIDQLKQKANAEVM
ncbi:MAG: 3-hydroxyacyl-CoA dehydrogenase [Alphaproteobacteria bacterium]|nr:3-hydroxyacyl-CoA dehydrogenase [Alphaproteobacteria bacterium]